MKKCSLILLFLLYPNTINGGDWVLRRMRVEATAYCPCEVCCGKFSDGKTATGRDASLPGIAVDPDVIPLGSRIEIPDCKLCDGKWSVLADDVGGAIKGYRIDIRFQSHEEALEWGRKMVTIRVWTKR